MQALQTPIAILVAGLLIAAAVIFSGGGSAAPTSVANTGSHGGGAMEQDGEFGNRNSSTARNVRPIDENDHIFGNPDAKVVIVEYSDFECPFCSQLHPTLARVVEESEGEVAWVYRHLPLTAIHSRAQVAAVASECVAELGGNDAFWSYSDALFGNYRGLTSDFLQTSAVAIGIDSGTFDACLTSGKHDARVQADLQNANASGGTGTPFSIVINGKGEPFPFAGALPYEQIKAIVGAALASS